MTDKGITKIFSKAQPSRTVSEEELHDEAVARALTGTRQLREEIHHWRQRAEKSETDVFTMKHEFDAKLAMARHDNDSLRKQNAEISVKMEHYQISLLKLKTKINDLEMFFKLELKRMVEAVNHSANGWIGFANGSASAITKFLDDFHEEIQKTEYAPNESPKPKLEPISVEEQSSLEALVAKLKPEATDDPLQH